MRGGAKGGKIRAGRGTRRGDVQDFINDTTRGPAGPYMYSGDNDTRERQRKETVTKAAERRHLKKRTRVLRGMKGLEGGTVALWQRRSTGPESRRRAI